MRRNKNKDKATVLALIFMSALCGLTFFCAFVAWITGLRGEKLQAFFDERLQPGLVIALGVVIFLGILFSIQYWRERKRARKEALQDMS